MKTTPLTSLRADTPEAGLLLARHIAERELALAAGISDMAAHLRASPSPHATELAARLFTTIAAANGHWLRPEPASRPAGADDGSPVAH